MKQSRTSKLARRNRASNAYSLSVKMNFSCTDGLAGEQNCRRYSYLVSANPIKQNLLEPCSQGDAS